MDSLSSSSSGNFIPDLIQTSKELLSHESLEALASQSSSKGPSVRIQGQFPKIQKLFDQATKLHESLEPGAMRDSEQLKALQRIFFKVECRYKDHDDPLMRQIGQMAVRGCDELEEDIIRLSAGLKELPDFLDKMSIFKSLPKDKRSLFNAVFKYEFDKSYREYEKTMASLLLEDPEANQFAHLMCLRVMSVMDAYVDVLMQTQEMIVGESPAQRLPGDLQAELRKKLQLAKLFAADASASGSVGFNYLALQKVVEKGNLRERMTLVYCVLFGPLKDLFSDIEMIEKVNVILLKKNSGFTLAEDLAFKKDVFEPLGSVGLFRRKEQEGMPTRHARNVPSSGLRVPRGPRLQEITHLSLREARVALEDYISEEDFMTMKAGNFDQIVDPHTRRRIKKLANRRVRWVSGADRWFVDPMSAYAQEVIAAGLPSSVLIAGPSNTTNAICHAAQCLGLKKLVVGSFSKELSPATKACIAWMCSTRDHSTHEVLLAATPFDRSLKGYADQGQASHLLQFDRMQLTEKIKKELRKNDHFAPIEVIRDDFQIRICASLGISREEIEGCLAEDIRMQIQKQARDVERWVQSVSRESYKREQIDCELSYHRTALAGYENAISKMESTGRNHLIAILKKYKHISLMGYREVVKRKVAYVKSSRRYKENPVYAMCVPQKLEKGSIYYHAGSAQGLLNWLKKGVNYRRSESSTAKATDPDTVRSSGFSGSEMGEKGLYASLDSPAYMGDDKPYALKFSLRSDMEGVSIPSISELEHQLGFSREEIEDGYREIHKSHPFLQHAGEPPLHTEVVFLHSNHSLRPMAICQFSAREGVWKEQGLEEFFGEEFSLEEMHHSWEEEELSSDSDSD